MTRMLFGRKQNSNNEKNGTHEVTVTATSNESYPFYELDGGGRRRKHECELCVFNCDRPDLTAKFIRLCFVTVSAYPAEGSTVSGGGFFHSG